MGDIVPDNESFSSESNQHAIGEWVKMFWNTNTYCLLSHAYITDSGMSSCWYCHAEKENPNTEL